MAAPARSCKLVFASTEASTAGRFTAYLPNYVRRFCEGKKTERSSKQQGVLDEERAPSTAEEFRRVAEEKTRRSEAVEKGENMSAGSDKDAAAGKGSPKN